MRNIWTKIGLGAAGVFLAGMMVVTLAGAVRQSANSWVDHSVVKARQALAAAARHDLPFLLSGARIGSIRHLNIRRAGHGELPEVTMLVELSQPAPPPGLADCELEPARDPDFDPADGFRCAAGPERDRVTVGRAVFEPAGWERPIRVSRALARDLGQGDPFEVTANPGGEVRIVAEGDSGETVRLLADGDGVSIGVNDGMERTVLRLLADSTGASLRVRGEGGESFRLEASQAGLVIRVDSVRR